MKTNLRVAHATLALLFTALAPLTVGCAAPTGGEPVGSSDEALNNEGSYPGNPTLDELKAAGFSCVFSNATKMLMCGKDGDPTIWVCNPTYRTCTPQADGRTAGPPIIAPRPVTGLLSEISPTVTAPMEAAPDAPIGACPLGDSSCVPPLPTLDVIGTWDRHAGTVTETLTLRPDATYSLVETTRPVCVRAPCPEILTTPPIETTGKYAVSDGVVALSPVAHDARLPEAFDIVRALPLPPVTTTTATTDGSSIVAPIVALHAVERGADIRLTRATTTADCPSGTNKCYQCGAYPPGGVCQAFVCLPPTQRCLPVP